MDKIADGTSEWSAVDIDLGTIGIRRTHEGKAELHTAGTLPCLHLSGVLEFDAEFSPLVGRHTGQFIRLCGHFGFGDMLRCSIEQRTGIVEQCTLLALVRAERTTGLREEHQRAVEQVTTCLRIVTNLSARLIPYTIRTRPIDAHGDVTLIIGCERETGGLLLGSLETAIVITIIRKSRVEAHREL